MTDRARGRRSGLAAEAMRRHNLGAVLERVHLAGALTRSELTAQTGLNRSTIAHLIAELTELGLVEEGPAPVTNGPGRPSPTVRARADGAVVLAVEIAVDSIAVATLGLGGHRYNRVRVTHARGRFSPEETVQDVAKLAGPLVSALPEGHAFAGVGVSVVGVTRGSDGFVHLAPNLGWLDVPLADLLRSALGTDGPVLVANDADLAALAEHRRGSRSAVSNLVFIHGEVGIGTGVIVDGRPLRGSAGYAGEAGHMLINPDGQRCRCGATGCWETEAGEVALLRRAGVAGGSDGLEVVRQRAAAGDRRTLKAIAETGRWLGLGIGDLVNLFNPELVVLGGFYEALFDHLEPSVVEHVRGRALAAPRELATVVPTGLGPDAALVGAGELILSGVIADPARTLRRSGSAVADVAGDPM